MNNEEKIAQIIYYGFHNPKEYSWDKATKEYREKHLKIAKKIFMLLGRYG